MELLHAGRADNKPAYVTSAAGRKRIRCCSAAPSQLAARADPEAARKLVKFLVAPSSEPFLRQMGMQPFVE
jgi:hypothetical protein